MQISQRLRSMPPYHFAKTAQLIAEKRAAGVDVIPLTMGDPDMPTPDPVIDRLCAAAHDSANHHYPGYYGFPELRRAIAGYFQRRFGVDLDPEHEVALMLGSKEGLAHLPLVMLDPGDVALIPDPGYTTYLMGTLIATGKPVTVPLRAERGWLPDLGAIPADVARKAKLLWLNYPNNPTGASANRQFFEEAIAWGRAHDVLIAHDNAYADVMYGDARPLSILQMPGAKDIAVELHSFSKTYNMAGFRVGMIVGNAEVIEAFKTLKTQIDTGMFNVIQHAALAALALPESWIKERNAVYERRRDLVVQACRAAGLELAVPEASLYLWPRVPAGETSQSFTDRLLEATGVLVTPGVNFGAHGEGYVRIALTMSDERLAEAARRIAALGTSATGNGHGAGARKPRKSPQRVTETV
jgi:LL-diaminopimelate aminotransferase